MKGPRALAALAVAAVVYKQKTLDEALAVATQHLTPRDRALGREIAYGTCRWYGELDGLLRQLLARPLKPRDGDIRCLMAVGIYQMRWMRVPDHAAVDETVSACRELGKPWATGLVNGILRGYQKQADVLASKLDDAERVAHPQWLLDRIRGAWPEQTESIVSTNNERAPMSLRINPQRISRSAWLELAATAGLAAQASVIAPACVTLASPVDVGELPGFDEGMVSVQDEAAQLAASLLSCHAGERVLDACAAPGGKACQLLEQTPGLRLVALDSNALRLARVRENLLRLVLEATLVHGDAAAPNTWWDGEFFDHILVDAPCSGTGVIRRHPDIKLLRTPAQVLELRQQQVRILTGAWSCLKPGGDLLYCTCSILPEENSRIVGEFLAATDNARVLPLDVPWGLAVEHGRQLLPASRANDGFYFAHLRKAE